jgi:hypothetical protein
MVVQCCACQKVRLADGSWVTQDISEETHISHGYCPVCAEKANEEIMRLLHATDHKA